jgi:DNA-binding XRE family transcriptional regulator
MLCHRMRQFREYNGLEKWMVAEILNITPEKYEKLESGKEEPTIELIHELSRCYRVTVDEFYGYTPRLTLSSEKREFEDHDDIVDESLLKMSNLTWEETQLILYYRKKGSDDSIIRKILETNFPNKE